MPDETRARRRIFSARGGRGTDDTKTENRRLGIPVGFFDKIKQSLTRTKEQFVERFEEIVNRADQPEQRSRPVDVDTIDALEEALISADIGVAATARIVDAVRSKRGRGESLRDLVKSEILEILKG